MECLKCGAGIQSGATLCGSCGFPLGRACTNCWSELVQNASYCHVCGSKAVENSIASTNAVAVDATSALYSQKSDRRERRQVTIMFCDLVESTALSTSLDPEDLNEVFRVFRDMTSDVIRRHGGTISSYRGDGIDALFGYPRAHEDDTERAVRSGLEVALGIYGVHPLPSLNLEVRVGIATGVVVLGDLIGKDAPREKAAVGSTPHLAARLQALAEPGSVLISAATHRLIGNLFNCADLGMRDLKGFAEPVQVWRVLGEHVVDNRFEAIHSEAELAPLVGRNSELQLLLERWTLARNGAGQLVTLLGEPGVGKSRLSRAVCDIATTGACVLLQYHCAERFENTALHPVIRQIERAAGISRAEPKIVMLEKLEALLGGTMSADSLRQAVPYIAAMLSIPYENRYAAIFDTPQRQKEKTLGVLKTLLAGLASKDPVLILCEDLHWADPSTLDLITSLANDLEKLPVFVLGTSRLGFSPPWAGKSHAVSVELGRLDRDAATSIVSHLTGSKPLPQPILEQILQKSDGVPLFIEELTKTVLESGHLEERFGQYTLTTSRPAPTVPSTLRASLTARLDRLSTAREIAEVGAALGREFSFELLAALLEKTDANTGARDLPADLKRLVDADLIQCRGTPPTATYAFKHALIQEAAYETILLRERRDLHAQIADVLESQFSESAWAEPEIVAHHFTEAKLPLRAIPLWNTAGQRAATRAAHKEAIGHFNNALGLVDKLPDDSGRQFELGLRIQLGLSLAASSGYAAPEVEAAYERARQICHALGDTAELFPVLRGLCTFYIVRCTLKTAEALARQCVRLGEETGRPDYQIEGYTALGYVVFYFGRLAEAVGYLSRAVEIYRSNRGETLSYPSPQDPCVASLCLLSHAACLQGNWRRTLEIVGEINAVVKMLGRPFEMAYAQSYLAMLQTLMANPDQAMLHAEEAIAVSDKGGFKVWFDIGRVQKAAAMVAGDKARAKEALDIFTEASAEFRKTGAELGSPFIYIWVGRVLQALHVNDQALLMVGQGMEFSERKGERYMDAELLRLRGELLLESGDRNSARDTFMKAISVAGAQGAHLLALRAALSLHSMEDDDAGATRARSSLQETLQAIGPDGSECPDVRRALAALGH